MSSLKTYVPGRGFPVISEAEMRGLEADAIGSGQVSGLTLMERAGAGVAAAILQELDGLTTVSVLCGPGNNGGDGYVIARVLHEAGHAVEVFALGDPARLPPDAAANARRWEAISAIRPIGEADDQTPQVVVDALFGIGLSKPIRDDLGAIMDHFESVPIRMAVDVPSGWDADKAAVVGAHAFPANRVVTFHAAKPVHQHLSDLDVKVQIMDIGL